MNKKKRSKGMSKILLVIGGAIGLLIIISIASGAFKSGLTISKDGQPLIGSKKSAKTKTYQSDQTGVSFEYPSNWTLKDNPGQGLAVVLFSPPQ